MSSNSPLETSAEAESQSSAASAKATRRRGNTRAMKWVRRAHMYLGLLLVPWVLLFGTSGFLFNHTSSTLGGPVENVASFGGRELVTAVGFIPTDERTLAAKVVESINASTNGVFTLADGVAPHLTGDAGFTAVTTNGPVNISINLLDGSTSVTRMDRSKPEQDKPAFAAAKVTVPDIDLDALGEQLTAFFKERNIHVDGPLTPQTRGAAALRFQLADKDGRRWNASYDLASGAVTGRAVDAEAGMNFYSAVTRLHKTHRYPDRVGARWFWVLIGDTMAVTMVFWGVSGLIMWWQIKPSRVLGTAGIAVAVLIAAIVFSGTLADYNFVPAAPRGRGGPGAGAEGGGRARGGERGERMERRERGERGSMREGDAAPRRERQTASEGDDEER